MGSTLPTLATELVELVSQCLERTDLLSLRLVSKGLCQKSFRAFVALFTTVLTDLSFTSLQRLQAICTHGLRLYVKKLLIEAGETGKLGQDVQWSRDSLGHLDMLSPGPRMLQDLLTHDLVNCRSFHIFIPGPMQDESDALTPSDAVGLILLLIPSLPSMSPVSSFIVSSPSLGPGDLDPRRLPFAHCRQQSFLNAWMHVQELMLEPSLTPETFYWSLNLVRKAPHLRTLLLNLGYDRGETLIKRLCNGDSVPCFLESLSLAHGHTTVAHLSQLIQKFGGTLRTLSLEQIYLSRFEDWPLAFERIRSQAPLLECISINLLMAAWDDKPRSLVEFPGLVNDHIVPGSGGRSLTWRTQYWKGKERIFSVNYRGPGVGEALKMLGRSAGGKIDDLDSNPSGSG